MTFLISSDVNGALLMHVFVLAGMSCGGSESSLMKTLSYCLLRVDALSLGVVALAPVSSTNSPIVLRAFIRELA